MLSIRKIGVIGRTYRHLNRYRQILAILFKYGFGDLLDRLSIDQYIGAGLQAISRKRAERVAKLTRPQRLRMACEELGPTYIKLGQILSTRPDLVPVDILEELSRLQDEVPPFPFEDVKTVIESEFGLPAEKLFDQLDEKPLASASIGQVHKARTKDGEPVAVKFQRPDIQRTIEVDLEIMLHLATLAERHIKEFEIHRPVKIVEEFARTLEKEIDYRNEATNMERIARRFLDIPHIYIPAVFREFTTSRVLTTELIEGIKISKIESIDKAGLDRKVIAERIVGLVLKQAFEHGFFHADPHPGNIFVLADNVICLVDYGMMGLVDRATREAFVDLMDSVVHQQEVKTSQVLLNLTDWDEEPDIRALEREVADFMGRHFYKPLKDMEIGKLLQDLLHLTMRFRLRLPPDIFLMIKALSSVEGVGRALDPDFDLIAHARPFIERVKLERFGPKRISADVYDMMSRLLQFLHQFPKDLMDLTGMIRQQRLSLQLEHKGLDSMLATQDQTSNRMSFAIIIAALIIGSALIVISEIPPLVYGISLIGIIGYLVAAIMGIWLLVAIIKAGRL
ncbi:MAG: AarF/ABC1/UbiB kinase family protein [Deltaproteobacteria bacterium]|jgi:ubiquinone biosynthesis protein|nr:AarF/ABC1/UbiB kinase family protein [Deltaproteobacteria bacterium]